MIRRAVVVGDVRGEDRPGAAFIRTERRRGRQRVAGRAAADARGVRAAVGADEGEPGAAGGDGFVERDCERRVERNAAGAVERRGRDNRRRVVDRRIARDRERDVVDRESVVDAGNVQVDPAHPQRRRRRQREAGDGAADRGAIGCCIAVERARCRAGVRRREVECVDVDPGARAAERTGVEAVLEIKPVAAAGDAEAPLLAGIGDFNLAQHQCRIVAQLRADHRYQRTGQQRAERALAAAGRAVAVGVAGIQAAVVGDVSRVRVVVALEQVPAVRQDIARAVGSQRAEVLHRRRAADQRNVLRQCGRRGERKKNTTARCRRHLVGYASGGSPGNGPDPASRTPTADYSRAG